MSVSNKVSALQKKFTEDLQASQTTIQTETAKVEQLKGAIYALNVVTDFLKTEETGLENGSEQPEQQSLFSDEVLNG